MAWQVGHPLKRDGTSQRQRPLNALLPENNPIDARTVEDGLIYAYKLAEKITFYDAQNMEAGNWQAFFPGEDPGVLNALLADRGEDDRQNVTPHLALFMTFLKLLELLKEELNGLTHKHLSFYYEEVLGFKKKAPVEDRVHVLFQLAKRISQERILPGTTLPAGKDALNRPLYYRTQEEIVVNPARVARVFTAKGDFPALLDIVERDVPADAPFPTFGDGSLLTSNLFVGIEALPVDGQLSLLFQVVEGTALNSDGMDVNDVTWSYWTGTTPTFHSLGGERILRDTTLGLQKPGIITFAFAGYEPPQLGDPLLGDDLFWIRAQILTHADNAPHILDIQAQAVHAVFQDRDNDPAHLGKPLQANSIKNFEVRNTHIRKVRQPYESFGGATEEEDHPFFARVSERLRHKQRAITIWDYEHLVLGQFEELYKVKAISHTGGYTIADLEDGYNEFLPGGIQVVLVPKIKNPQQRNALKPQASKALLTEVKDYLTPHISPSALLRVTNPRYEEILVDFGVGFKEGYDRGLYRRILNESIKRYLSPWAYEEGADISFGGRVYKSQLLAFVENQPYVEYVTDFKLIHQNAGPGISEMCIDIDFVIRGPEGDEVELIEASTAASILISSDHHNIKILLPGSYPCVDSTLCEDGIGCMIIDIDFEIEYS